MYLSIASLPAHRLDAAADHDHRLGLAVEQRRDVLAEVLDDDLRPSGRCCRGAAAPSRMMPFIAGAALDLLVVVSSLPSCASLNASLYGV